MAPRLSWTVCAEPGEDENEEECRAIAISPGEGLIEAMGYGRDAREAHMYQASLQSAVKAALCRSWKEGRWGLQVHMSSHGF